MRATAVEGSRAVVFMSEQIVMFTIIVPLTRPRKHGRRWIHAVSYPASGFPLYTRQQAIELLERMAAKGMTEAYAESETERFDLESITSGK